jgi:DNA polymerase
MKTYDILDAGPRNRFMVSGKIVHNCTGSGPQPTNLPKAGPDQKFCKCCSRYCGQHHMACAWCGVPFPPTLRAKEWNARMAEQVINDLHRRDYKYLEHHYGPALETVSGCLRGLFTAAPGHTLVASDFNAIEAVVTAQLAGEEWRLEVFRTHGKIYEMSAAKITGTPFEEFMAHRGYDMTQPEWWKQDATGSHHPLRGKIGKFAELALGFGGWVNGMKAFGADKYLSDQEIKTAILGWRDASPSIVELWGGQYRGLPWDRDVRPELYGLEGMAIAAILNEGHWYEYRDIAYKYWQNVLYCRLPSGRCIHYQRPRLGRTIYMGSTDAGREKQLPAWSLQFEGWNTNPKNGPMGWIDIETYGGRLTENCIAEGTLVLTARGWCPIEDITPFDRIHDGVEFVRHGGKLFKSEQTCVIIDGVHMTPDHEVLTDEGWKAASQQPRPYRPKIRDAHRRTAFAYRWQKVVLAVQMRLRESLHKERLGRQQRHQEGANTQLWLHDKTTDWACSNNARDVQNGRVRSISQYDRPLQVAKPPSMGQLWGAGHHCLRTMAARVREFLGRHGRWISQRSGVGTRGQLEGVLTAELHMGELQTASEQQTHECIVADGFWRSVERQPGGRVARDRFDHATVSDSAQLALGPTIHSPQPKKQRVWDIVNCGPRQRFVVLGDSGPFIVHNCVQAVARDYQRDAQLRLNAAGYPIVLHVYDENVAEVIDGWGSLEEFESIMKQNPSWAQGWPINASGGWSGTRYRKD